jgi:hypothetical protein
MQFSITPYDHFTSFDMMASAASKVYATCLPLTQLFSASGKPTFDAYMALHIAVSISNWRPLRALFSTGTALAYTPRLCIEYGSN